MGWDVWGHWGPWGGKSTGEESGEETCVLDSWSGVLFYVVFFRSWGQSQQLRQQGEARVDEKEVDEYCKSTRVILELPHVALPPSCVYPPSQSRPSLALWLSSISALEDCGDHVPSTQTAATTGSFNHLISGIRCRQDTLLHQPYT